MTPHGTAVITAPVLRRRRTRRSSWPLVVAIGLFCVSAILPLLFMAATALRTQADWANAKIGLPTTLSLGAFERAWTGANIGLYFRNSLIVTSATVALSVVAATLAGYAFSKLRWRLSGSVYLFVLAWIAIPPLLLMVPIYVEMVQLGNELSSRLPEADGARVRRALRELGVSVFVVKSVREQMRFDTAELVVEAGKPFEIICENVDVMPHNLVVVAPGARQEIGVAAMAMPATPDKAGRLYVPDSKKILAATKMLEPGQKETLKLRAPREPGEHEFVCTFPGHWTVMWGRLVVTTDPEAAAAKSRIAPPSSPPPSAVHQHGAQPQPK